MGTEAWVMWQPDWDVITFDANGGAARPQKQYYALAQYTRFIRPGFQIISAGGAYHTLAAYSPAARRLVLVTTNWDTATKNDLDLGAFTGIPSSTRIYRTTAEEAVNFKEGSITISSNGHIIDQLPVRSVTTYVIDAVSPLTVTTTGAIEGLHQIVSVGTKLCMNIPRSSTKSGDGIIPYPCGDYGNEEFNFVDQGNGFYSIQTVNGTQNLCLNISTGTVPPGDGKTLGAPGNLIQWGCSEGSLFDNELFKVVNAGGDHMQIRVKSSGLCLEDPGRGGTLRQDRCSPTLLNQQFTMADID